MQNAHIASCRGTDFEYDPNCGTYLEAGDRWVGCRDWSERHIIHESSCVHFSLCIFPCVKMFVYTYVDNYTIQREIKTRLQIQKKVLNIHRISTETCFVQLLSCSHPGPSTSYDVSRWIP